MKPKSNGLRTAIGFSFGAIEILDRTSREAATTRSGKRRRSGWRKIEAYLIVSYFRCEFPSGRDTGIRRDEG